MNNPLTYIFFLPNSNWTECSTCSFVCTSHLQTTRTVRKTHNNGDISFTKWNKRTKYRHESVTGINWQGLWARKFFCLTFTFNCRAKKNERKPNEISFLFDWWTRINGTMFDWDERTSTRKSKIQKLHWWTMNGAQKRKQFFFLLLFWRKNKSKFDNKLFSYWIQWIYVVTFLFILFTIRLILYRLPFCFIFFYFILFNSRLQYHNHAFHSSSLTHKLLSVNSFTICFFFASLLCSILLAYAE